MAARSHSLLLLLATGAFCLLAGAADNAVAKEITLSLRLIHLFSDEAKLLRVSRNGSSDGGKLLASSSSLWPRRRNVEYYQMLFASDVKRQKMKLGSEFKFLFFSEGSQTMSFGNDFGWSVFICSQQISRCSLIFGASIMQDRDLNEYIPSGSSTSKHLSCSHQLCQSGPSCKSLKQPCPYVFSYYTENTWTSGFLVEDILHLAAWGNDTSNSFGQASVIIGCGMKQSGGYLDGVAPDGLMGLGLGQISVPSFLSKAGFVRNSFSLCFDEDNSGGIFFGDQGPANQHSTSFLPSTPNGNYDPYIVGVEAFCIGNSCIKHSGFTALVDSGTSFTFVPQEVYEKVSKEASECYKN